MRRPAPFDGNDCRVRLGRDGDGSSTRCTPTGTARSPIPITTAGTFNVKLRVTDDEGSWDIDTLTITVSEAAIELTVNPPAVNVGERIDLSATAHEPVTGWTWDLDGNGSLETTTGTTAAAYTSITQPGVYTLKARAVAMTAPAPARGRRGRKLTMPTARRGLPTDSRCSMLAATLQFTRNVLECRLRSPASPGRARGHRAQLHRSGDLGLHG